MKPVFVIIFVLLAAGLGFFGGMKYIQNQRSDLRGNFRAQFSPDEAGRNSGQVRFSLHPVSGEIISVDENSLTVKMPDGQSKIILFSADTRIIQASRAAVSDLKTGNSVAVFGSENSDGSIKAGNIQLNPLQGRFGDFER